MQFYSPLPKGVRIQRQEASDALWEDWQYYADDCQTYFGLENNGPLSTSNSVNCLELSTYVHYLLLCDPCCVKLNDTMPTYCFNAARDYTPNWVYSPLIALEKMKYNCC